MGKDGLSTIVEQFLLPEGAVTIEPIKVGELTILI